MFIYGKKTGLDDFPSKLRPSDQQRLLQCVYDQKICVGNNDEKFLALNLQQRSAYMCSGGDVKTIRHNDCALLVEKTGARCAQCMKFRSSLSATVAAQAKQSSQSKTLPSSRAPLAHLTHREPVERCKLSKKREYSLVAKNKQLVSKKKYLSSV